MKIALIGYGKMGKTIEQLALKNGHKVVLKINRENLSDLNVARLKEADVAIEFSTPQTVINNVKLCFEAQIPVVIGTTSWSNYKKEIEDQCLRQNGAMISASNFSLGVNLFFELNKKFAKIMEQYPHYKISISEIHHTAKLDAPSGTAITLAEEIIQHNNSYQLWENNKNTAENVLPIESLRIPDVPGTHIIKYTSKEDIIEINHTAINRDGFAAGALIAAEWLIDKKGVYTMKDVLNLN